jgi:TP901 family phage tail tape measure protein
VADDRIRVVVDADADPLRRELGAAGAAVRGFGGTIRGQSRGAAAFNAALNKQRQSLAGLATFAARAGVALSGALVLGMTHAIRTGMDFESQMARVMAVTGATAKEMDQLRQLAMKLGADTKFSAGEAAEAMYELASAGFQVQEMEGALTGTLSLAAASGIELGAAAEISANALRGFGLDSTKATHVADVLAKAVNSSSVEMTDLQLTMKYLGPIARATGQDFEEMIAAVSVMGDAGIKGEQAGTTLRAGLVRLVKPTKQVNEGLKALGLEASDLTGPNGLLPLPQLVAELQGGMDGLTKSQQANALASVFGTEALSGMLTLVDAGPGRLAALAREFENSQGASAKAARTMNDTVAGALDQLTGSIETVEIALYEQFKEPLKEVLLDATDLVNTQGRQLQKALEETLASPEFDRADFGGKLDMLAATIGEQWRKSGVQEQIADGLVDVFNFALPRVAEAAGQGAVSAAGAFAQGFLKADSLGKLVISAWLFTKLGGFAALRAAGSKAGVQVGAGMATELERSAAARTTGKGALGTGIAWGKSFIKGFGISMIVGGGIAGAMAPADGVEARMKNIVSGATLGLVPEAGASMGGQLAAAMAQSFDENLRPALQRRTIGGLHQIRSDLRNLIKAAIEEGASDAELQPLRDRLREVGSMISRRNAVAGNLTTLRSGLLNSMADIRTVLSRQLAAIDATWDKGTRPWRQHVAASMRAAVVAIGKGIERGEIETRTGLKRQEQLLRNAKLITGEDPFDIAEGFARGWRKAGTINRASIRRAIADLDKMPPAARQRAFDTMVELGQGLVRKERIPRSALRTFVSKALAHFDDLRTGASGRSGDMAVGVANNVGLMADAVLNGMGLVTGETNKALRAFNAQPIEVKIAAGVKAAAQIIGFVQGITKADGGFVSGHDRRDHVHAILGSEEAVLTVHDQPEVNAALGLQKQMGFGRHGSLPELFAGPRRANHMATGGFAGRGQAPSVPKVSLQGTPGALQELGQGALDMVVEAARDYVRKHAKAVGGGNIVQIGRSLQRLGYEVGEHPAFGGVAGVHVPGSAHYSGRAIDVNDDAPPYGHGSSEMPSLDWLAKRLLKLPHSQIIWRNRDLDTGAAISGHMDHLHFAMALGGYVGEAVQRKLAEGGSVAGISSTAEGAIPSQGRLVGASYYGGPTDGVSGTVGAAGVSLPGTMSFAELAMGEALGGLPFRTKLKIGYAGRSIMAEKLDIGAGGSPVKGHNRAIDLWYEAKEALGMPGLAVVKVSPVEGGASGVGGGISEAERKRREAEARKKRREDRLNALRRAVKEAKTLPGKRGALWKLTEFWGEAGLFDRESRSHVLEAVRNAASQPNPLAAVPILSNLAGWLKNNIEISGRELGDKSLADEIDRIRQQGTKVAGKRRKRRLRKIAGRGLSNQRREILEALDADIDRSDETIDVRSREANSEAGPGGSELTDDETSQLVGSNRGLLGSLFRRRDLIKLIIDDLAARISEVTKEIKAARSPSSRTHWKLAGLIDNRETARQLIGEMREGLVETQGVTGEGGRIFDVRLALEELGAPRIETVDEDTETAELLRQQRDEALVNLALSQGETSVLSGFLRELGPGLPFLGAFMQGTGGRRVGRTGWAILHEDEHVIPDPKGPTGSQFAVTSVGRDTPVEVTLVLRDRAGQLVELVDARVDNRVAKINQQLGADARRREVAPGRL